MWVTLTIVGMTTQAIGTGTDGWVPDDSTFGARLALVRQRMEWGNVTEAATACGIPVETWRSWERGGLPRDIVGTCRRISLRTDCRYDWLLDGRPNVRQLVPKDGLLRRDSNTEPAGYIYASLGVAA